MANAYSFLVAMPLEPGCQSYLYAATADAGQWLTAHGPLTLNQISHVALMITCGLSAADAAVDCGAAPAPTVLEQLRGGQAHTDIDLSYQPPIAGALSMV